MSYKVIKAWKDFVMEKRLGQT